MIEAAFELFTLKKLPFTRFDFPRWQSWLVIIVIGALAGLDPSMRESVPNMPILLAIAFGVLLICFTFPAIVLLLKWWMKRGGRWDGHGDLFNLIVSSWLVADLLGAGLTALGVPGLLTLPILLYSIWVSGNALHGAIPTASMRYSIGGILLSLIPMFIIIIILSGLIGLLFGIMLAQ